MEAHLEGDEAAIDRLIERMRWGPPAAEIEDVLVEKVEAEGADRFEVRH